MSIPGDGNLSEALGALQDVAPDTQASVEKSDSEGASNKQEAKPQEAESLKALEERIRREEQSKRDRMLHQKEMQLEQEAKRRADEIVRKERERIARESLDDEEYGRLAKKEAAQRDAEEASLTARQRDERAKEIERNTALRNRLMAKVPEALRPLIEAKENDGTIQSFEDFEATVIETIADHKAKLAAEKDNKVKESADQKDSIAAEAALAAPVISSGTPLSASRRQLSTDENLNLGIGEALKASRKK